MPLPSRVREIPPRIVLLVLFGLLAALGTLQYRWSGELSAAERVRMRAGAQERTESFARDFDRELTRAFLRLGHPAGPGEEGLRGYAEQVDAWRASTTFPGLVAAVLLVEDGKLQRFQDRAFVPAEWPAAWTGLRERLAASPFGGFTQVVNTTGGMARAGRTAGSGTFTVASVGATGGAAVVGAPVTVMRDLGPITFLPDGAPALILPVMRAMRIESVPRAGAFTRFTPPASLVVVLDLAYLRTHVLPALAERHFARDGSLEYVLAIARSDEPGAPVWQSAPASTSAPPDASAGLLELRPEDADERDLARPRVGSWRAADARGPVTFSFGGRFDGGRDRTVRVVRQGRWQLAATHRAGSLDAVVTAARHRNVAVSFGILTLLGASAAFLVVAARRAQRLARRQVEFVAGVTHELRTPLAVIRSAGENLADGVVDRAHEVRRYGELVRDEGRRLTALVEEALELAGAESGRVERPREPVAMGALLHDTLRAWGTHAAGRGVRADAAVAPDLPAVLGDEDALRRALTNLLDNAVKHGGERPWVGVRAEARGAAVAVTVEDQGPGIPADEREQVFEPFFRGRDARARRVQGSGLGLSLVRGIVESHGGSIRIEESSAGGAAFTMTLPALPGGVS